MSNNLLVQNTKIEGSGYLGDLLKNNGFEMLDSDNAQILMKIFQL